MSKSHRIAVLLVAMSASIAAAAQAPFPVLVPTDPRSVVATYFAAIRRADETAAFKCWENDCRNASAEHREHVEQVVRGWIRATIAAHRFNEAVEKMFPADIQQARRDGTARETPTPEQIAKAQSVRYLRLALVKWGTEDDAGLPMVADLSVENKPTWKISMQQWYEVNGSSVGDARLLAGYETKVLDLTTKDVLAGKLKTKAEIQTVYLRHFENELAAMEAAARTPAPKGSSPKK